MVLLILNIENITSKLEILLQLARVCNYYICVTCNTVAVISSDVLCVYRSRGVSWCRGPPLFDHRTMHKDGWNSIWFQPTLEIFVHDKLVCLKMCLQSDLSLVSTHNSLFFGLPTYCTYHMVVKGTVIGNTDDSLQ